MNYSNVKESYPDSLSQFDLKIIFKNPQLGVLNFDEILSAYEGVVSNLLYLETEDYRKSLFTEDVNVIDSIREQFIVNFNGINSYDIAINNPAERETLIAQFTSINESYKKTIYNTLTSIKIEKLLAAPETIAEIEKKSQQLDEITKQVEKIELMKQEFESRLAKFQTLESSTKSTASDLAQKEISGFFENQSREHRKNASLAEVENDWLGKRKIYEWLIFGTVIIYIIFFFLSIFFLEDKNKFESLWGYRSIILFGSLIVVEYVGLYFVTKNYNREKDLEYTNANKANIAKTLKLITIGEDNQIRSEIITNATKTLFSDLSTIKDGNNITLSVGDLVGNKGINPEN